MNRTRSCPFRALGVITQVPPHAALATFPAVRVPPNGNVNTLVIPPRMQKVPLMGAYPGVENTLPVPYATSWPVVSAAAGDTEPASISAITTRLRRNRKVCLMGKSSLGILDWARGRLAPISESQREAGRDPPIGRPVREPLRHRARHLQRLEEFVFGSHAQLQGIGLAVRDGGGPLEERKDRERLNDRIGGPHAPAEGVA